MDSEDIIMAIQQHVDDHHLGLAKEEIADAFEEHNSLMFVTGEITRKLDLVVNDWFGEPFEDVDGEIQRVDGWKAHSMEHQSQTKEFQRRTDARLREVEHAFQNGGVPAKLRLSRKQKVGVWAIVTPILAASMGGVLQIIAKLV